MGRRTRGALRSSLGASPPLPTPFLSHVSGACAVVPARRMRKCSFIANTRSVGSATHV
jgi:hypothetical protein